MPTHAGSVGEQSGVMQSEVLQNHLFGAVPLNSVCLSERCPDAWELLP